MGKSHYLLYTLVSAIYPRMLMTFDENLKPLQVPVRVGTAVDVVGQAGHPKTITGSQTHTTPVLIGHGERAELATDDCTPPPFSLPSLSQLAHVRLRVCFQTCRLRPSWKGS
jgi:26S proteasome regulatory subunit N1